MTAVGSGPDPQPCLDLDLSVPGRVEARVQAGRGQVIGVIGPNGAGKSSLLRAVAGLLPARGRVHLDGRDLTPLPVPERRVGMVFQDQRLFPHLSTLDNVAFGPRARGVRRGEAERVARVWLTRLGLGDLAERRPGQLSGGQAQRVAIARALAAGPGLLLLDEPFSGLDATVAAALRLDLAQHLRDFAGVTLLVTHDALEALTLTDRLLVLAEGRVVQEGSPGDVAARPRSEHVARLVGLNVVREGDRMAAFAPHAVTVSGTEPHDSSRHRWRARVASATPHGDAVRLMAATGEHGRQLLADVTPGAVAELGLQVGAPVWLSVKETAMEWYPAVSEAPSTIGP